MRDGTKAKRWVIVFDDGGGVTEVAVTSPDAKRLKAVTRDELLAALNIKKAHNVYPINAELRITPTPEARP